MSVNKDDLGLFQTGKVKAEARIEALREAGGEIVTQ